MNRQMKRSDITTAMLRQVLNYDPTTGLFSWKTRGDKSFDNQFAGKPALITDKRGYKQGWVFGVPMLAHRVAWAMHFGFSPCHEIDHKNGDKSDNRIANLRDVTRSVNMKNISKLKANISENTGVHWHKRHKRWCANIRHNGKKIYLGSFKKKDEAVSVWQKAKKEFGFNDRHGL